MTGNRSIFGLLVFLLIASLMLPGCVLRGVRHTRHIVYSPILGGQQLNVFAPRSTREKWPVLVFIHGGNWNAGKKELYNFLGNRLARKRILTVVIDYPLSPQVRYDGMARASAEAVVWTKHHIDAYGGDSTRIFVSGHSAGGHLAALIGMDNRYFDSLGVANPIKGLILIDAAGLDMHDYLAEQVPKGNREFLDVFTDRPDIWRQATPMTYLHRGMPPMLIFRGGKTYPSILASNEKFVKALRPYQPELVYVVQKPKHHVAMIAQFLYTYNPRYRDIQRFMANPR